jgi:hypothetical protein
MWWRVIGRSEAGKLLAHHTHSASREQAIKSAKRFSRLVVVLSVEEMK